MTQPWQKAAQNAADDKGEATPIFLCALSVTEHFPAIDLPIKSIRSLAGSTAIEKHPFQVLDGREDEEVEDDSG